ncbi:hypothetical protein [Mycobacterium sp. IS-1742]|uniref:hypothetical protein n=1 Tax=Mycobacterium sp. IS-1742 TaxID=1772285 RepID=UPI001E6432E4|nr:hypothetical protein [Mycobacterium sp. IS-1742]
MLIDDDVQALDRRAREVGGVIGWDLQFVVAPNAEYVGLAAGGGAENADQIIVLGPSRITDLAVHEIDVALDALGGVQIGRVARGRYGSIERRGATRFCLLGVSTTGLLFVVRGNIAGRSPRTPPLWPGAMTRPGFFLWCPTRAS